MNISNEQVQTAIAAGLQLTNPEADLLDTFRKHAGGIMILRQLLLAIGNGDIKLAQGTPSPVGEQLAPSPEGGNAGKATPEPGTTKKK